MVDDFSECPEADVGRDGATAPCQQRPYFTDYAREGGAVDAEPAGQYVVGGTVAEVDEDCQQAVDEDELAFRTGITARREPP